MKPFALLSLLKSKLSRSAGFKRAHTRISCSAVGEVLFIERGCRIGGVVDEVSQGGIRLRPANNYILRRMGEDIAVRVTFGRFDLDAILVNTSPQGYGFKLTRLLKPEELDEIVATT